MPPLVHALVRICLSRLGRVQVVNMPNGYSPPGAVIVCNHVGWAESFWLGYALYPHQVHFMAKRELFRSSLIAWVMKVSNAFPVDRDSPSRDSIRIAVDLLRSGKIVVMYPGGTRTQQEILFKRGAAAIAGQAGVDLLPVFYQGPPTIRFGHLIHRAHINVTFGFPLRTAGCPRSKPQSRRLTEQLQESIYAMKTFSTRCDELGA
jgi:1-acyl-sn-glycerol-3-phosphate acyltransferase